MALLGVRVPRLVPRVPRLVPGVPRLAKVSSFQTVKVNHFKGQNFTTKSYVLAKPRPAARPAARPPAPAAQPAKTSKNPKTLLKQINEDPKKRKILAISLIVLYLVSGWAGVRYLQDTKYKATGEESPYKKTDKDGNVIEPQPIKVIEGHDTTPVYDGLAKDYDDKIWLEELTSYIWYMRRKVMKQVKGDVLEVSCGTGRNLKYFRPKEVSSITFLDSSAPMLEVARDKFDEKYPQYDHAQFVQGRAEDLVALSAKSGQKFDTVYESFGLCSHEDPAKALENMKALVRPGGRIVLLEHGRGYYDSMNKRMDEKAEDRAKEWGCRWNLDIDNIVEGAHLEVEDKAKYHFGTISFYVLKVPETKTTETPAKTA